MKTYLESEGGIMELPEGDECEGALVYLSDVKAAKEAIAILDGEETP